MKKPTRRPVIGVLIVHENPFVRLNLEIVLRKLGFWGCTARDTREALQVIRRNRRSIRAALLGIRPKPWTGVRAARELKQVMPGIACGFLGFDGDGLSLSHLQSHGVILDRPLLPSLRGFLASLSGSQPFSKSG